MRGTPKSSILKHAFPRNKPSSFSMNSFGMNPGDFFEKRTCHEGLDGSTRTQRQANGSFFALGFSKPQKESKNIEDRKSNEMYHALFQNWLFWLSNYPWSVPYSWVLRNREMFHRTYRYNQLKKVEGNTRRIKSASQKAILLHMAEKLDRIRSYTYQKGIYLWFGAPKWIRALNINGETYMKCWEAGHAEKHTICWKACFVVTLSCLLFLMEMVKLKCWEAGHAEKHKICWKAGFVVTLSCLFFWRKWWNLNHAEKHKICWKACFVVTCLMEICETYMKCWEAQNLLKNMFCCDMSIFLMEMAKLTWNAEKQVMLRNKKHLLKSMFCCDMSNFLMEKT